MKRLVAGFLAVLMVLVGCVAAGAEGMTPGTYTAEAEGFHGTIKLEVTVDAEAITGIEVVEHSETAGIGEAALPVLVESVLEHQTTGVDSVAGATVTSEAFKAALTDALTQAGADMDKMSQPVEADELEAVTMEADVVVVGDRAEPLLLAECKAPGIPVGRQTLAQAVRYNSVLGARYLVLTNGRSHYCYELVEGEYRQCDRFPSIGSGMGD